MGYAPISTHYDNDGSILGCFVEKEFGLTFEFTTNLEVAEGDKFVSADEFPHKVWINDFEKAGGWPFRYARILKTCAYVVVDEDADGNPVIEKWDIKGHRLYR